MGKNVTTTFTYVWATLLNHTLILLGFLADDQEIWFTFCWLDVERWPTHHWTKMELSLMYTVYCGNKYGDVIIVISC